MGNPESRETLAQWSSPDFFGIERRNRVAFAIQNEIGGIEIHADVVEAGVLNGAEEGDGRFLAGFHEKGLSVRLTVAGDVLNGFYGVGVE